MTKMSAVTYGAFLCLAMSRVQHIAAQVNAVGMGQTYSADANTQTIANTVMGYVQQALGGSLQQYQAQYYRTQPASGGTNIFIKVFLQSTTTGAQYIHLRIFYPNSGQAQIMGMEMNRSATDPISYIFVKQCSGMRSLVEGTTSLSR